MKVSTHVRRSPARAIRITARPGGLLYGYVVENRNGREITVEWLGRSPSIARIQRAARQWGASLPGEQR